MRDIYQPLYGRPLALVEHDSDWVKFTFLDDGGPVRYKTYGDCCSTTWIEHITIPDGIVGTAIFAATEPELPPHPSSEVIPEEEQYGDVTQVYHTALATNVGHIIIEYRNSSNGYYGGSLELDLGGT